MDAITDIRGMTEALCDDKHDPIGAAVIRSIISDFTRTIDRKDIEEAAERVQKRVEKCSDPECSVCKNIRADLSTLTTAALAAWDNERALAEMNRNQALTIERQRQEIRRLNSELANECTRREQAETEFAECTELLDKARFRAEKAEKELATVRNIDHSPHFADAE